jgi:hypothetical protein
MDYQTCDDCGLDMDVAFGCTQDQALIADEWRNRSTNHDDSSDGRCQGCGATHGQVHHYGCAIERCPVCGDLLSACDCSVPMVGGIRSSEDEGQ